MTNGAVYTRGDGGSDIIFGTASRLPGFAEVKTARDQVTDSVNANAFDILRTAEQCKRRFNDFRQRGELYGRTQSNRRGVRSSDQPFLRNQQAGVATTQREVPIPPEPAGWGCHHPERGACTKAQH